jgi:DNA helicase IV
VSISSEAKSLIEEEQQVLSSILNSLRQQLDIGHQRLVIESDRARELTSNLVAARRDVDKQMLASDEAVSHQLRDLKRDEVDDLNKLLNRPYFARLVLKEFLPNGRNELIEYKLGTTSNTDCRIIDWRKAPIAKLYYDYKEGEEYCEEIQGREREGVILLRNKVEIEKGVLKRIICRHGDFTLVGDNWQCLSAEDTRARTASKSKGRLPDVLSFITKEQYAAITEDADSAVLIQGIAGSGKTTVALYRLAWLLHEDNSILKAQDVFISLKSPILKSYIDTSLRCLDVDGCNVSTFGHYTERAVSQILYGEVKPLTRSAQKPSFRIRNLKHSIAMLKAIEQHVSQQNLRAIETLETKIKWAALPSHLQRVFTELCRKNTPIIPLLTTLKESFKEVAADNNNAAAQNAENICIEVLKPALLLWEDIFSVLKKPRAIASFDETGLLDEALVSETLAATELTYAAKEIDYADDALLLFLYQQKTGKIPSIDKRITKFEHLIVDEVQDFSPLELAVLINSVNDVKNITLAGDAAQQIGSHSFLGWDRLKKHWQLEEKGARQISLTVSHRSTLSIMRLADYVAKRSQTTDGRPGKAPLWYKMNSEDSAVREAIGWLRRVTERYPNAITAVLCKSLTEARYLYGLLEPTFGSMVNLGDNDMFTFDEGILVTSIKLAKGLEFFNVLVWNPSAQDFPPIDAARNLLYVGLTRAEEHLALVTYGEPTALLPSVNSKLVRGMEEQIETEDEDN